MGHGDLIDALFEAITKGVSKDVLMRGIKDAIVAASDAEMQREFPNEKP
jgi:hypothetical protein